MRRAPLDGPALPPSVVNAPTADLGEPLAPDPHAQYTKAIADYHAAPLNPGPRTVQNTQDFASPVYPVGGIGPPSLKHTPITTPQEIYAQGPTAQQTMATAARTAYMQTGNVAYLHHGAMTVNRTAGLLGLSQDLEPHNQDSMFQYMRVEEADLPPNYKRAVAQNNAAVLDPNNQDLKVPHPWVLQTPDGGYAVRKGEARSHYIQWWQKQKKLGGAEQGVSANEQAAQLDQQRHDSQYDQTPYPGAFRAAFGPDEQNDIAHLKGQLLETPRPENIGPEDFLNLPGYVGGKAKRTAAGVIGAASQVLPKLQTNPLYGTPKQDEGLKQASEALGESARKTLEANPVDSSLGKLAGAGPEVLGAVGSAVLGGPAGAAIYGAGLAGGNTYQTAFDDVYRKARVSGLDDAAAKGIAHAKAFTPAVISGAVGAVLQQLRLPIEDPAAGLLENAFRHALAGGTIGTAQETIDQVSRHVSYGRPINAQEILDAAIDNAAISAGAHLGMKAFGHQQPQQAAQTGLGAAAAQAAGTPPPSAPGMPPPPGARASASTPPPGAARPSARPVNPAENASREALGIPLDEVLNADSLKQYHRAAVKQHHPDAGGDPQAFLRVQEAFNDLSGTYANVKGPTAAAPPPPQPQPQAAPPRPEPQPAPPPPEQKRTKSAPHPPPPEGFVPMKEPADVQPTVAEAAPSPAENAARPPETVARPVAAPRAGGEGNPITAETNAGAEKPPTATDTSAPVKTQEVSSQTPENAPQAPPATEQRTYGTVDAPDRQALGEHFAEQFAGGKGYPTINEARREAAEKLGGEIKPGTAAAKMVDEAVEIGVVRHASEIVRTHHDPHEKSKDPQETFDKLLDLYNRQPNLNVRTSTSIEQQAYSTPAPLAFLAQKLAQVSGDSSVYEPTAGNGMLLIGVGKLKGVANELNPDRAAELKAQGRPGITQNDAADYTPPMKVDTVLANPPFGAARDESGRKSWNIDGVQTNELDHAITLRALQAMKDDGTAAIILGAKGMDAMTPLEKRKAYTNKNLGFYRHLYDNYNVVDHFTVGGDLYARQGAKFPVDVIVIHGRGKSARPYPWKSDGEVKVYNDWHELAGHSLGLPETRAPRVDAPRAKPVRDVGAAPAQRPAADAGSVPEQTGGPRAVDAQPAGRPPASVQGSGAVQGGGESRPAGDQPRPVRQPRKPTDTSVGGPAAPAPGVEPDQVPADGDERPAGGAVDPGDGHGGVAGRAPARKPRVEQPKEETTEHQAEYKPASDVQSVGTLVPRNMQTPIGEALADVQAQRGDLVSFVSKELKFPDAKMGDCFSAEQIDALALAMHQHKTGSGFILGDQTGVGKGRVVAGMIRYAQLNDMIPVFVTQQAALFGDMVRDLNDIGQNTKAKPFEPLTTNVLTGINKIPLPDGRTLMTRTKGHDGIVRQAVKNYLEGGKLEAGGKEYHALFTTYSQLQSVKGETTWRHALMKSLGQKAFLILDESHEAGGTANERKNKNAPPDRAEFVRDLVRKAGGVLYSSATYAKRPDVMDLYSKTDMALAVDGKLEKLAEAIKQGGVPLQQVTANMLAQVGQYIRRERTFAGVTFAPEVVPVDLKMADQLSESFRAVRDFDEAKADAVAKVEDQQVGEGGGMGSDSSTGGAGVTSTNFASILWNVVDQMLLALKAEKVAETAIAAVKAGERPVIVVDNTMEAVLDRFIEGEGLKRGDPVPHDFKALVHRYLERSREVIIKDDQGEHERHYLTDAELGPVGLAAYNNARRIIEKMEVSKLPISPIDFIAKKIKDAGLNFKEITGRGRILDYQDNGPPLVADRPESEVGVRGKVKSVKAFNDAGVHGILLNRSASTGLSLHSSPKFGDQRRRHMIIGQAAKNIDTFMQMLGRVHRTGQKIPPKYTLLLSDAPAENRPAAVLVKKLASLNASVTANSKGAVSFDAPDLMNEVGDQVVGEYLQDNPEMAQMLDLVGETPDQDGKYTENLAAKATGRAALMPVKDQQEFWADMIQAFENRINELNATNDNPLVAQTMDLDAKSVKEMPLFEGTEGSDSPFAGPANLHEMDVKRQGKPYTSEQVKDKVKEALGGEITTENKEAWQEKAKEGLTKEYEKYRKTIEQMENPDARFNRMKEADRQMQMVEGAIDAWNPGASVNITAPNGDEFTGFVLDLFRRGKPKNPAAGSAWNVKIAVSDALREVTIPLSRIAGGGWKVGLGGGRVTDFDNAQSASRESRYIATGNLLAAFGELEGGRIIHYTDHEGAQRQGILMPKKFEPGELLDRNPIVFDKPDQVMEYLKSNRSHFVRTTDDQQLKVLSPGYGSLLLEAPKSKAKGAKYTLNKAILKAAGQDFTSVGSKMRLSVTSDLAPAVLKAVMNQYPLGAYDNKDAARAIMGQPSLDEQTANFGKGGGKPPAGGGRTFKGGRRSGMVYTGWVEHPINFVVGSAKMISRAVDWYSQPLIEKVEKQAGATGKSIASTGRHANDYARSVVGELNRELVKALHFVSGRTHAGRKAVRQLRKVRMVTTPDVSYGYSVFQSAVEAQNPPGTGRLTIGKAADQAVQQQRALVAATGVIAVRDGWKVDDNGTVRPFVPARDGKRMLRAYTAEFWDISNKPDFDPMKIAVAKAFGHANGRPWQDMMREINDAANPPTSKKNQGGGEILRRMKFAPTHVVHPNTGRVIQIMHAEPFDAAAKLVQNFSLRAGYIKHFGQDLPGQDVTDALIEGFKKNGGNPDDVRDMVRSFHGIPLDPVKRFTPGTAEYEMVRMVRGFISLAKAGALTMAAVPNVFETLTKTWAMVGTADYARAWAEILRHPNLALHATADIGARTVDVMNWMGRQGHPIEAAVRSITGMFTAPLRIANELNEFQSAVAGMKFAKGLSKGRDEATLRLLGFTEDEIDALTSSTPPADLLGSVAARVAEQTQGTTSRPSEQARSTHSRTFRNIFTFQNWPAMTMNRIAKMVSNIYKPGISAGQRAQHVRILSNFLFGSLLAGAMSAMLLAYIKGGKAEVAVRYAEAKDTPSQFMYDALKFSMLGGLSTTTGEAIFDNHDTRLMGPIYDASMPLSILEEMGHLAQAMKGQGVGKYKGLTPLEAIGEFMTRRVAMAPSIATAAAALGFSQKNVKLDVALRAYARWRRANPPKKGEGGPDVSGPTGDAFSFTRAMRQYQVAAQQGNDDKAIAALSDALDVKAETVGKDAGEAVAQAIRARQILSHLSEEEGEKLKRHIGPDAYGELEEWDAVLEGWAMAMKPRLKPTIRRK